MSVVHPAQRVTSSFLASLEQGHDAPAQPRATPDAKAVLDLLHHASDALDRMQARCAEVEAVARDVALRGQQQINNARAMKAEWQARVTAQQAHVDELEARLALADETAMELRTRLISLYGKLAASNLNVRAQPRPPVAPGAAPNLP